MQKPWFKFISRANSLGILISVLGFLAFAPWPVSYQEPPREFSNEPSFLEEWWNAGQGKGLFGFRNPFLATTQESLEMGRLISWRADSTIWTEDAISDLSHFILEKSDEYKVSPFLVLSLIDVESGFRPSAVSSRGAVGLMQLLPTTAEEVAQGSGMLWHPKLLENPKSNIDLGLRYMMLLKKQFGSAEHVLTAYNIGPQALRKRLSSGQQVSYAYYRRVSERMRTYQKRAQLPHSRSSTWANAWL